MTMESMPLSLERDVFLRSLLRHLSGNLQDVVGLEEASGLLSLVGGAMGNELDQMYREEIGVERLSREQVAEVLVDLKRRIRGDFFVIEQNDDRIVLGNRACPFAEKVEGRPSLCMMTSNVFGTITAENLGYAKVDLEATIAEGDPGCRVVVHLRPSTQAERTPGRVYYRSER